MKQTAVQWLIEQLTEIHPRAFDIAKAMEKEQIIEAYKADTYIGSTEDIDAEQYYNDTYEQDKQR